MTILFGVFNSRSDHSLTLIDFPLLIVYFLDLDPSVTFTHSLSPFRRRTSMSKSEPKARMSRRLMWSQSDGR